MSKARFSKASNGTAQLGNASDVDRAVDHYGRWMALRQIEDDPRDPRWWKP